MHKTLLALSLIGLTSCASHSLSAVEATPASTEPSTQGVATNAVDADGYLQAVDPFEVRIRPKAYSGDLTITSIIPNGSSVKAGDVLLELDATDLKKQLAAAKNDRTTAQANADRSEADAKLAELTDALSLRQAQDAASQADDAVKWWEAVDGPQMLLEADLQLKEARAGVEDQQDELDQLKKMYKSEELTNATADIVEKRAIRSLEIGKTRLQMTEQSVDERKRVEYPITHQKVLDGQKSAHYALQQVQIAQAQSAIARQTGLVSAHAALNDAQKKAADLEADEDKLTVKAAIDGNIAYGAFSHGAFSGDPKALRVGEKVPPQQVLMSVYQPGKLTAIVELPQAKFEALRPGLSATLKVEGTALTLQGVCDQAARTPGESNAGPIYTQVIKLNDVDATLVPGNRVKVHIELPGS